MACSTNPRRQQGPSDRPDYDVGNEGNEGNEGRKEHEGKGRKDPGIVVPFADVCAGVRVLLALRAIFIDVPVVVCLKCEKSARNEIQYCC